MNKPISLNDEQQAVVSAREGVYATYAGPGSGKTFACVQRLAALIEEGVSVDDILALSFTVTGAKNLRTRVEKLTGPWSISRTAGSMTLHSLALKFAEEERDEFDFELAEFPLATEPIANKLSAEAARRYEVDPRSLRSQTSLFKRRRVRPNLAVSDAEKSGKAADLKLALAYKDFDKKMRAEGVMDFDSLMFEMVELLDKKPSVRARWQYRYVICDEAQDCCQTDWQLLRLLTEKYGNLMCVGDPGQCQPPGTKVLVVEQSPFWKPANEEGCAIWKRHKFDKETRVCKCGISRDVRKLYWKETPIEKLTNTDKVVSWTKQDQRMYPTQGRKIEIASRQYDGELIKIFSNNNETRVTPEHWLWTRWNQESFQKKPYFVYLMYRSDRGFRIGISHIRKTADRTNQLTLRGKQEKADKMWILKFVSNKQEAEVEEEILSLRYQIPQSVFHSYNDVKCNEEQIKRIFLSVPKERGFECLNDHGLLFSHPLIQWPLGSKPKFHGYFKTAACNLVPEFMDLPTKDINRSAPIDRITRERYSGDVYSLEVEKDHTYIADGIPVGNSIYAFRGASTEMFLNMEKMFPGTRKLYLAANYRSTPELVEFLKGIGPVPDLAEKFHTSNEHGPTPKVVGFNSSIDEVVWVINQIKGG